MQKQMGVRTQPWLYSCLVKRKVSGCCIQRESCLTPHPSGLSRTQQITRRVLQLLRLLGTIRRTGQCRRRRTCPFTPPHFRFAKFFVKRCSAPSCLHPISLLHILLAVTLLFTLDNLGRYFFVERLSAPDLSVARCSMMWAWILRRSPE